jgi:hypothetical protein
MPASQKQMDANRANAGKSTGPRTPGGKERSKMNAVTHGLTAQSSVLPGEDRSQLEALSESLMGQLKPRGVVQRIVAERVVSLAWKLRRVARAEEAAARQMEEGAVRGWEHERAVNEATGGKVFVDLGPRPRPRTAGALLADSFGSGRGGGDGRLVRLTEYELKLDAALRAGMRELLRLQKEAAAFEGGGGGTCGPRGGRGAGAGGSSARAKRTQRGRVRRRRARRSWRRAGRCGARVQNEPNSGRGRGAEVVASNGVAAESSAPAPGTSASPPPGPRR